MNSRDFFVGRLKADLCPSWDVTYCHETDSWYPLFSNKFYIPQIVRSKCISNVNLTQALGWGVKNLNCNFWAFHYQWHYRAERETNLKMKTWVHDHLSDLFLLRKDCIPEGMVPRVGCEKATGWGMRRLGSGPSFDTNC